MNDFDDIVYHWELALDILSAESNEASTESDIFSSQLQELLELANKLQEQCENICLNQV